MNELVIRLESVNPVCIRKSSIQFRERWHTIINCHEKSKITDPRYIMSFLGWAMMKLPLLYSSPRLDVNELFYSGVLDSSSEYFKAIKSITVIPESSVFDLCGSELILAFEYQSKPNKFDEFFYSKLNYSLLSLFSAFDCGKTSSDYYSGDFGFTLEIRDGACRYIEVSIDE